MTTDGIGSGFGLEAIGEGMEVILPSASFFFARIVASEDPFAGAAVLGLGAIESTEAGFTIEGAGGAEERPFPDCGTVGTGDVAVADVGFGVGGTEVLSRAGCDIEDIEGTSCILAPETPLRVELEGLDVVDGADVDPGCTPFTGEAIGWPDAAVDPERLCCLFRTRSYSCKSVLKISTVFFFGFLTFGFTDAGPDADADTGVCG